MKLITCLIKKKFRNYFRATNWKILTGDFLLAFILFCYAYAGGILYDITNSGSKNLFHLTSGSIFKAISFALILIPLIIKFFPSVSLKKLIIAPQYPLSIVKKATIDLFALSLYKTVNASLFLSVIIFSFTAKSLPAYNTVLLFLLWGAGFLIAENIINAVSWQKYLYLFMVVLLLIFCYLISTRQQLIFVRIFLLIAVDIVLLILYYLFYQKQINVKQRIKKFEVHSNQNYSQLILKLLLRNKTFRIVITMGIVFKLGFIIFLFYSSKNISSLDQLFAKVAPVILLISPVILFTYVFNNIWGYFHSLQLNHIIVNNSIGKEMKTLFSIVLPVLIVDFIATFSVLYPLGLYEWKILLFYFACSIYCIPIGIISSYTKYFYIAGPLNFSQIRGHTSFLYSLILILPIISSGFVYRYNNYLYLVLSVLLVIGLFCLFLVKKYYQPILVKKLQSNLLNNK
jgi:hypothetical protein